MPTYKGDDGLSEAERRAYAVCQTLSCRHADCLKKNLYVDEKLRKERCGPLYDMWRKCFDSEVQK